MMAWTLSIILSLVGYFFLLPPNIPLWYSRFRPEDQMANKAFVFMLPGLITFAVILERFLGTTIKQNTLARSILSVGSVACSFILLVALIRILVLVT
jgi:hypothetical protein